MISPLVLLVSNNVICNYFNYFSPVWIFIKKKTVNYFMHSFVYLFANIIIIVVTIVTPAWWDGCVCVCDCERKEQKTTAQRTVEEKPISLVIMKCTLSGLDTRNMKIKCWLDRTLYNDWYIDGIWQNGVQENTVGLCVVEYINSMLPGVKNSLICRQLLHKSCIRFDTTPLLFHMLIGGI